MSSSISTKAISPHYIRTLPWNLQFILILARIVGGQQPCDSNIYCYGSLLRTVQLAGIFKDSKTFVDMGLKHEPYIIRQNFLKFQENHSINNSDVNYTPELKEAIERFVNNNFNPPEEELELSSPQDFLLKPKFLSNVADPRLRKFGLDLHNAWAELERKIKKNVEINTTRYSMIYVSQPFVIPGERFREFYYWDQLWIIKGLLVSEMTTTVRETLENFFQLVEELGYIPNGNRVYYRRSQPPLLIQMVNEYLKATGDFDFVKANIETMDKEFDFWMNNRSYFLDLDGKTHKVFRYNVELIGPRPESYVEDFTLAQTFTDKDSRNQLYMELKTAAESGVDFSSRWIVAADNDATFATLVDCRARHIIPIDLNVIILLNAKLMAKFHFQLGNILKALYYKVIAAIGEVTINQVFWDETQGFWFDYIDLEFKKGRQRNFYSVGILPLMLVSPDMTSKIDRVLDYLKRMDILNFPGGVPSSLVDSGQQWDFPNGWAPHVHWFIESLEATGSPEAEQIAFEVAQKWVTNNFVTFKRHNDTMFEKYNVLYVGQAGHGGEYEVAQGFGWSNGVVLDLLAKYGGQLKAPTQP